MQESVDKLIDKIVTQFQPLSYFRTYLTEHLSGDFVDNNMQILDSSDSAIESSILEFSNKIVGYVEKKVQTALILGKYDDAS